MVTPDGSELCAEDDTEDMAIQCYPSIAEAITGRGQTGTPPLWDAESGFFKDLMVTPDGSVHHIDGWA